MLCREFKKFIYKNLLWGPSDRAKYHDSLALREHGRSQPHSANVKRNLILSKLN